MTESLVITPRAETDATTSITINGTSVAPEFPVYDYFIKEFDIWEHYLQPNSIEWFFIVLYCLVFIASITGNGLGKCLFGKK